MSLFPRVGTIGKFLPNTSIIFWAIMRFELKISFGVRGMSRSMSCLCLSAQATHKGQAHNTASTRLEV